jgi:hypothetical protein
MSIPWGKVVWAGVALRLEDGSVITIQFPDPQVRIEATTNIAKRDAFTALCLSEVPSTVDYDIHLKGTASRWDGASTTAGTPEVEARKEIGA